MKAHGWALFLVISVLGSGVAVSANPARSAEIKRIDAYVKVVRSYANRSGPQLVVADVADFDQEKPDWKKFGSVKLLDKYREDREVYDSANNWFRNNKLVLSVITLSSPSGDWAKYLRLYYRNDGSLAKADSELRTFHGTVIVMQGLYFDRTGKLLKKTIDVFDLATKKRRKPDSSYLSDDQADDDKLYRTTKKLPFAHVIQVR
ncbi:MAG: hypothetical protein ABI539_07345 [Acidobacteriota bacterium]